MYFQSWDVLLLERQEMGSQERKQNEAYIYILVASMTFLLSVCVLQTVI